MSVRSSGVAPDRGDRDRGRSWGALLIAVGVLAALLPLLAPGAGATAATAIEAKYAALGGANSRLGAKVGDEVCGMVRDGCYQRYQGGHIHWSPATGAHASWGAIMAAWGNTGWERGVLGYPVMDESCGLVGGGCYQNYEYGAFHWSPASGAHWSRGEIRNKWAATGWEHGFLGYPLNDETCGLLAGGCYQTFQGGSVHWTGGTGAHFSRGTIRSSWGASNWEWGPLGYPTGDELCTSGECHQSFQGGRIDWTRSNGVAVATSARLGSGTPVQSTAWRTCTPTLAGNVIEVAASQRTVTVVDQTSQTGATLSTFTRTNSNCGFTRVVHTTTARLGYGGTVWWQDRVQNTGTTPRGSFLMTESFGNGAAPGTEMPYRVTTDDDYWVLDRNAALAIFNEPRRGAQGGFATSEAERLRDYPTQYRYSVVIDFNRKSNGKVPSRGGGIFLHVHGSGATAGCVSVSQAELEAVMRYLKPGDRILITA